MVDHDVQLTNSVTLVLPLMKRSVNSVEANETNSVVRILLLVV